MRRFFNLFDRSALGCDIFACLLFGVFPVFLVPGLFFTLNYAKYGFLLIVTLLLIFYYLFSLKSGFEPENKSRFSFTVVDWAILSFCSVYLISGLVSEFFPATVNGADGRFNGMLTVLCYTAFYFVLTRNGKWRQIFFVLLAVSSALVYLLGILNYFQVDPLGAYDLVREDQKAMFLSTIGNRNFFSAYICITLPVFMTLFCCSKGRWKTVSLSLFVLLGETALLISNSDSGFVGLYIVFLTLPLFLFCKMTGFRRYWLLLFSFFAAAEILRLLTFWIADTLYPLSGISALFVYSSFSQLILLVVLFVCLAFCLLISPSKLLRKRIQRVWMGILILLLTLFATLFLYFSLIDRQMSLGGLEEYLRFSPEWGSNRGSVWMALILIFLSFSPLQILIGTGPDTIYQVLSQYYPRTLGEDATLPFDSAHNEYLQYLITAGVLGLIAYCVLVGVLLVWALRRAKDSKLMACLGMSIFCYLVQGFFNISMVSVTPLFFLVLSFVGIDYYHYHTTKKKIKYKNIGNLSLLLEENHVE